MPKTLNSINTLPATYLPSSPLLFADTSYQFLLLFLAFACIICVVARGFLFSARRALNANDVENAASKVLHSLTVDYLFVVVVDVGSAHRVALWGHCDVSHTLSTFVA